MTTPKTAETGATASPSARLTIEAGLGATKANVALKAEAPRSGSLPQAAMRGGQTIRQL